MLLRRSLAVTAAGVLGRIVLEDPIPAGSLSKTVGTLLSHLPDTAEVDVPPGEEARFLFPSFYSWYAASLVLSRLGGEYWRMWRESLFPLLETLQERGAAEGSWAPRSGFLGVYGGRMYTTVFALLCLETAHVLPAPRKDG